MLEEAGLEDDAVEILFTGQDKGIQGEQVQYFQRSLTVDYVMNPDNDVLLCYEINGQPLPPQHGFPLRLLVPGWLGMTNVKWIDSIEATSTRLTERQMKWYSYAQNDNDPNRHPATFQQVRAMMIPPGIPDFLMPDPPPRGDVGRRVARPRLGRRASHRQRGGQPRRWRQLVVRKTR